MYYVLCIMYYVLLTFYICIFCVFVNFYFFVLEEVKTDAVRPIINKIEMVIFALTKYNYYKMNRTLNSLQKIKFNPLVNRIIFEQGKKKYLVNRHSLNRFNLNKYNANPVIIRKYTTSSNNRPPDDKNVAFVIGIVIGCCINVLMY